MNRLSNSALVAGVVVAGLLLGASCTSDGDSSAGTTSTTSNPTDQINSSDGDGCTDPTGDISEVAGTTVEQGTLTEPKGIDLVTTTATVNGPNLDVSYTTVGPIDQVPNAEFYLAQGEPQKDVSFETRVTHDGTGAWTTTYISWRTGDEVRTPIPITPTVAGNSLTFSLPLADLPPIANYLAFGASAEVADGADNDAEPDVVFDDCSSLSPSSDPSATTGTVG